MLSIPFTKLHGFQNDFVLIDTRRTPFHTKDKKRIQKMAHRKTGIGFDQLIVVSKPSNPQAHARIRFFNADGSACEMCGNGLRAAALYYWTIMRAKMRTANPVKAKTILLQTSVGLRKATLQGRLRAYGKAGGCIAVIETEMGKPRIQKTPLKIKNGVLLKQGRSTVKNKQVPICVNVGNPHAVFFMPTLRSVTPKNLTKWGSKIEHHPAFPKRTNVQFVQICSKNKIQVKVWERGAGITKSCGTGAVATALAAIKCHQLRAPLKVQYPGGEATVRFDKKGIAYLSGLAKLEYSSSWSGC